MEFLTGVCPACGKDLQIPAELSEFSCLYCGARLGRNDLLAPPTGSADVLLASLGNCITAYRNTISHLMPQKYEPRFTQYCQTHGALLETLDEVSPTQFDTLATALIDHIAAWVAENKSLRQREDILLDEAKYTLCLLFMPAVQQLAPRQGKAFCEKVLTVWLERFPKQPFQVTTYEQIAGGFRSHKLCFITTAVCTYQGKADDCAELTAFRSFRDGWLRHQPFGQQNIRTYYHIAPAIVTAINITDPDQIYPRIWEEHLRPCYEALLQNKLHRCRRLYTAMVRSLRKQFKL